MMRVKTVTDVYRFTLKNSVKKNCVSYPINPFFLKPWSKFGAPFGVQVENLHVSACQSTDLPGPTLKEYRKELTRTSLRVKRTPFMKNLFKGIFDRNILAFPEVMNQEELDSIQNMSQLVENFLHQNVDSKKIQNEDKIDPGILEGLKDLGLFASKSPEEFGGLELKDTEIMWLMESLGNSNSSLGATVNSHHSLMSQLLLALNDQQKDRYKNIFSGQSIVALAMTELRSGSDTSMIQMEAHLCENDTKYLLNGQKMWVTNGDIADVFVVTSLFRPTAQSSAGTKCIAAFLVDKNTEGVKIGKALSKLGLRGLNTCTIDFENVLIPKENLIRELDDGFKLALEVFEGSSLSQSALLTSIMKRVVNQTTEHCIMREQFHKPISNFESIQDKITRLAAKIYASESLVYMTAGLYDSTENPDLMLESATTKIYTTEALRYCIQECINIVGRNAVLEDGFLDTVLRDSTVFPMINQTNDITRLYIALTGCISTGRETHMSVDQLRNPLHNPKVAFFKMIEYERMKRGHFKTNLDIPGYLHGSLFRPAEDLELAVKKLEYATNLVLVRHGQEVVQKQLELLRLSNICMSVYLMTCVLSRASRAYCIGLPRSQVEIDMAHFICQLEFEEIQRLVKEIEIGDLATVEALSKKIARDVFINKGYPFVNPSLRNY